MPSYQVSDYASLERDADMGFYFSSPVLGQVFPRLPNTLNVGFIHCRYANHQSGEQKSSEQFFIIEGKCIGSFTTLIYRYIL